jgi:hypothetical protein
MVSIDTGSAERSFSGLKTEFIDLTLSEMREAIRCRRYWFFPRIQNQNTLATLGITAKHAFDVMLSLSDKDYYSGPDPDWDRPGEPPLWVFKKMIQNEQIYIKFKIINKGEDKHLLVISFHIDRQ